MTTTTRARRTALVTGAGTRVGAAIARELGAHGFDVLVHYGASADGARRVADELAKLGARAEIVQADLYDRADVARLAETARRFSNGALDALVHNAGNFDRVSPDELSAEAWDRAMGLNVNAPYLLSIALIHELRAARGAIVAIADIAAQRPFKNYLPYSVSKAALAHLIKGLAVSFAPEVRANAIAPGTALPPEGYDAEKVARIAEKIPLGRVGTAEDIARGVLFFIDNPYVTGQLLPIDGGRSLV